QEGAYAFGRCCRRMLDFVTFTFATTPFLTKKRIQCNRIQRVELEHEKANEQSLLGMPKDLASAITPTTVIFQAVQRQRLTPTAVED
ncbi:10610_t:CDS:2, partial [Gigaspora margarita]